MKKTERTMSTADVPMIAKKLKYLMKIRGITEGEIAKSLNTSIMTVRRVISGETEDPRISTLKQIANYFGVSIDYLVDENSQLPWKGKIEKSPTLVPILDWSQFQIVETISDIDFSKWDNWYPCYNSQVDNFCFALESRPSMQSRFPLGTLFIINPNESPIDGDLILIKVKENNEVFLKELIVEYPSWILESIISGSSPILYNEKLHTIVGVIVLSVFLARK